MAPEWLQKLRRIERHAPALQAGLFTMWVLMILIALFQSRFVGFLRGAVGLVPGVGPWLAPGITVSGVMTLWWVFWWPLTILSVLIVARAWCGWLCPLGAGGELMNQAGYAKPPRRWMFNAAFPFVVFIAVVLSERSFGMLGLPAASAYFFLIFLGVALLVGTLVLKRAFCKLLCPIGMLLGIFSRLSLLHLTTDQQKCERCVTKACAKVCPTYINISKETSTRDCILCFRCASACPVDAVRVAVRAPGAELARISETGVKASESLFIITVLGLFLGLLLLSPSVYAGFEPWFNERVPVRLTINTFALGSINALAFYGFLVGVILLTLAALYAVSALSYRLLSPPTTRTAHFLMTNYLYTPFVFAGLFSVTGEGLFALLPSGQVLGLFVLTLGLIGSVLLASEMLSRQPFHPHQALTGLVPHLAGLSLLFALFTTVLITT